MAKPKLIDCKAAAERLCISAGTLSNWRIKGMGPRFVRIGGKVCYEDDAIDDFILSGVRRSTSETEAA